MFVKESQSSRQFRASSKSLPARGPRTDRILFHQNRVHGDRGEGLYLRRPNGTQTEIREK